MTKTYAYTYRTLAKKDGTDGHKQSDWYWKEITFTKRVTDRMEERNSWKKVYAADYFTQMIRKQYGGNHCVHTRNITEI